MNLLPFERSESVVLKKRGSESSSKYGVLPEKRKTEELISYGIVNIDKPSGPSSHQVSDYVKKILGIGKAGHSGTLDPKVTGSLPVALGRGTRVVQALLVAGKEYVGIMHLHKEVDDALLAETCSHFVGKIDQLPPVKSSIKRRLRQRKVYYFEILDRMGKDVMFKAGVQAGTYIRKLVHDIGERLGCGAHMHELRRTKAGPFSEDTMVTLQELSDAFHFYKKEGREEYIRKLIQPVEHGVVHLPKVWVMDTTVDTICHGASLKLPGIAKLDSGIVPGDMVAVMSLKDELISIGAAMMKSKEMLKKNRGIGVRTSKVFMLPGTYPKIEGGAR